MPDYSEILDYQLAQAQARAPSSHALMAMLRESQRGAAVLEELLGDPSWDVFRSNIEGYRKADEAERATLRDAIERGTAVGDERARADFRLQYLRGRLEAFQIALDLPKALIDKHETLEKTVRANGAPPEPEPTAEPAPEPARKRGRRKR